MSRLKYSSRVNPQASAPTEPPTPTSDNTPNWKKLAEAIAASDARACAHAAEVAILSRPLIPHELWPLQAAGYEGMFLVKRGTVVTHAPVANYCGSDYDGNRWVAAGRTVVGYEHSTPADLSRQELAHSLRFLRGVWYALHVERGA